MIGRLLRKDFLLNWSMVVLLVVGLLVVVALFRFGDRATGEVMPIGLILFFGSFYGSLLPILAAARTDRYRTGGFEGSLPVTRRQFVAARYLLPVLLLPGWVALTYGALWAFSGGWLPPGALHAETLLLAPAALVVMMGLFYPLVMRVGFMGMLFGGVGLQVVGLVLTVAVRRVRGVLGLFDAIGRIGPALRGLHADLGDPGYALAVVGALAAVYLLSFLVTDTLQRGRDL
jgi:hypothetical protein